MATINSQLSVTNLDLGLVSSTSETENRSSFLAVFETVQGEANAKQQSKEGEQAALLKQAAPNKTDTKNVAPDQDGDVNAQVEHEKVVVEELGSKESAPDKELQQKDATEIENLQDDVSITQSKEFQHLVNLSQGQNNEKSAIENTGTEKLTPSNHESLKTTEHLAAANLGKASTKLASESESSEVQGAASFLAQLTKSQSLDVALSKSTKEDTIDNSILSKVADKSHNSLALETDVELSQNVISLEKEFSKLDKNELAALKQLFAKLGDESAEKFGLSKQDIRQIVEKLNVALEGIEHKSAKSTTTLAPEIAKPEKEGINIAAGDTKNKDSVKLNENVKSSLTKLIDDNNVVVPAEKLVTITRPDKQMPHTVSPVGSAIAQAISDEAESASLENPKNIERLNQQAPSAAVTQEFLQKQSAANRDVKIKQVNNDDIYREAEIEKELLEKSKLEHVEHRANKVSQLIPFSEPANGVSASSVMVGKKLNKNIENYLSKNSLEEQGKGVPVVKAHSINIEKHNNNTNLNNTFLNVNDSLEKNYVRPLKGVDFLSPSDIDSIKLNKKMEKKQILLSGVNTAYNETRVTNEQNEGLNSLDLIIEENEQSISFNKLLTSLKANTNTPILSQLASQIQSSQLQQAELREVNQQHVALQTVQVIQNTKESTSSAEQLLQQPVNIARSDAAKALFDKANMLLNLNLKEAEIRLDPPELGSMQIRIRSDAEQAQINFVVQSQQAKEMLEQSMGRLRDMLAEQGINLGESNVSEQGQSEQQMAENARSSADNESGVEGSSELSEQILSKQKDGIDFYA